VRVFISAGEASGDLYVMKQASRPSKSCGKRCWETIRRLCRLASPSELTYFKVVTAEQRANLAGVVSVDPGIMHGTPCFTGTRVPVQTLLDYIEDGDTLDSFLRDFSTVKRDQAIQFLELAKDRLIECVSS